jgi:hypothetical protein
MDQGHVKGREEKGRERQRASEKRASSIEGSRLDTASRDVTRAREALGTWARRGSPATEQATGQTTTRRCSGPAQGISWRLGEWFGEAEKGGEERGEERRGGRVGVCD